MPEEWRTVYKSETIPQTWKQVLEKFLRFEKENLIQIK